MGNEGDAFSALEEVIDLATLAISAEAVGIMEKMNEITLEYTKTREQFGETLSSFQALQHRMVDTFMAYEQTKSLLLMCAHIKSKDLVCSYAMKVSTILCCSA